MIKRYSTFIAVLAITIVTGIGVFTDCFEFCKREIEIIPGLRWRYYSERHSCLIWDKFGMIADGRLELMFCDYGLYVHSRGDGNSLYLDLLQQRVVKGNKVGANLKNHVGVLFSTDAQAAIGIYSDYGKVLFERALNDLRVRMETARLYEGQRGER